MPSSVIIAILTGLAAILEKTGLTSAAVQSAITMLTNLLPILIKEYNDVLPSVKNIIAVLKGGKITAEQLDALDALEAKIDSEYDDAVDEYNKNHPEGK